MLGLVLEKDLSQWTTETAEAGTHLVAESKQPAKDVRPCSVASTKDGEPDRGTRRQSRRIERLAEANGEGGIGNDAVGYLGCGGIVARGGVVKAGRVVLVEHGEGGMTAQPFEAAQRDLTGVGDEDGRESSFTGVEAVGEAVEIDGEGGDWGANVDDEGRILRVRCDDELLSSGVEAFGLADQRLGAEEKVVEPEREFGEGEVDEGRRADRNIDLQRRVSSCAKGELRRMLTRKASRGASSTSCGASISTVPASASVSIRSPPMARAASRGLRAKSSRKNVSGKQEMYQQHSATREGKPDPPPTTASFPLPALLKLSGFF